MAFHAVQLVRQPLVTPADHQHGAGGQDGQQRPTEMAAQEPGRLRGGIGGKRDKCRGSRKHQAGPAGKPAPWSSAACRRPVGAMFPAR
ncbi:hypothetical protein D9M71_828170 [compost metagenome]